MKALRLSFRNDDLISRLPDCEVDWHEMSFKCKAPFDGQKVVACVTVRYAMCCVRPTATTDHGLGSLLPA